MMKAIYVGKKLIHLCDDFLETFYMEDYFKCPKCGMFLYKYYIKAFGECPDCEQRLEVKK